mmetsp:Transcript_88725/g.253581  ORF Transcript_88725/g.253581 Transcript_88725/m.253581 type:complete len:224 (-) Transcript_88725:600-1271(-)
MQEHRSASKFFMVFDDVMPAEMCKTIYQQAVDNAGKPWGVYVTLDEAAAAVDAECTKEHLDSIEDAEARQKIIASCAIKHVFLNRAASTLERDYGKVHGIALWCLSADVGSRVKHPTTLLLRAPCCPGLARTATPPTTATPARAAGALPHRLCRALPVRDERHLPTNIRGNHTSNARAGWRDARRPLCSERSRPGSLQRIRVQDGPRHFERARRERQPQLVVA